jgi:hypothetical protein
MSKTEALEMISFRSRSSSSKVQAFRVAWLFRMIFSGVMLVFRDLDPRGSHGNRIHRECCGARKGPEEQATID